MGGSRRLATIRGRKRCPIISGSIMGSEQSRQADFNEATQRLSSIFAPYSCPQRETLTPEKPSQVGDL